MILVHRVFDDGRSIPVGCVLHSSSLGEYRSESAKVTVVHLNSIGQRKATIAGNAHVEADGTPFVMHPTNTYPSGEVVVGGPFVAQYHQKDEEYSAGLSAEKLG